jgi:hypothetical protein
VNWPTTASVGGLLSDNCTKNPDFCNFNRVFMKYCDGNSFSGNRDAAVPVVGTDGKSKDLFFRGRRILDETLAALKAGHGLGSADSVLLTGCSAGGLSTFLHTDYVGEQLKAIAPGMCCSASKRPSTPPPLSPTLPHSTPKSLLTPAALLPLPTRPSQPQRYEEVQGLRHLRLLPAA